MKPLLTLGVLKRVFAVGGLVVSNAAMMSCALIPMSCGDLHDGVEWYYVSWRDYVHDASLTTIYVSTIISGFAAGYMQVKGKRMLLILTILFAILQSIGIDRCPTSPDEQRLALLAFEVLAIALAQFLHYGTINHLAAQSVNSRGKSNHLKGRRSPTYAQNV